MHRKFPIHSGEPPQFVFHTRTNQVGIMTEIISLGTERRVTVRLAGGNLMTAPAAEFRPATKAEIEQRLQTAALPHPSPPPVVSPNQLRL